MQTLLMRSFRGWLPRLLAGLLAAAPAAHVLADESYPSRPITLVVGYAAGGTTDGVARALSEVLGRGLRTRVVVENVSGASGALGAQKVVQARPDGYTLLLAANGELTATKLLNPRQPYDGLTDLTPIGVVNHQGGVLLASRHSGVKSFEQYLQLLRANPGKYNYASNGIGSMFHYAGEVLRERTGTRISHVPYRSVATLGSDLAGGTVEFGFMGTAPAKPFIDSGVAVPLAVTSATRTPLYPNVPALSEFPELKGYNLTGWLALLAPKGVPEPVIARLKAALKEALKDPQLRRTFTAMGGLPIDENEDLPRLMREETDRYRKFFQSTQMDTQK